MIGGDRIRQQPPGQVRIVDDRRVALVRIRGVELLDPVDGKLGREQRPVDLVSHVAAEVPGHGLEPGERIDRPPWLGCVVSAGQSQQRVRKAEFSAGSSGQPPVDSLGIGLEVSTCCRAQQRQFLLGDPSPAHGSDEHVGVYLAVAEQLREAPGRYVPAKVHLPEPVLGVHVALCAEQVLGRVGIDVRYSVLVSDDLDLTGQGRQGDRSVVLREGPAHRPEHKSRPGDQREYHDPDDGGQADRQTAAAAHRARVGDRSARRTRTALVARGQTGGIRRIISSQGR